MGSEKVTCHFFDPLRSFRNLDPLTHLSGSVNHRRFVPPRRRARARFPPCLCVRASGACGANSMYHDEISGGSLVSEYLLPSCNQLCDSALLSSLHLRCECHE